MKADRLSNWDAVDLARILVERFADAEDLAEAFPAVGAADSFDSDALPEFIEKNWEFLLGYYEPGELEYWLEEKEFEEEWEKLWSRLAVDQSEFDELNDEEYCWKVIEAADMFRYKDLAELHGHPRKIKPC